MTNMNNMMIFCTCCEYNKKYYIQRVYNWYNQLKNKLTVEPQFFVFVDGEILPEDYINDYPVLANINWVNITPALGRKSIWVFPGWKRSFKYALEYSREFQYTIHIESDVILLNPEKIQMYFTKDGYYCGWCNTHKFIDSTLMILNNKENNQKLIERYSSELMLNENIDFERNLMHMFNWNIMFNGDRIEGHLDRFNQTYDFISQAY